MELLPHIKTYAYFDKRKGRKNVFEHVVRPKLFCDEVCRNFRGKKLSTPSSNGHPEGHIV